MLNNGVRPQESSHSSSGPNSAKLKEAKDRIYKAVTLIKVQSLLQAVPLLMHFLSINIQFEQTVNFFAAACAARSFIRRLSFQII